MRSAIDTRRDDLRTQFEIELRKESRRLAKKAARGGPREKAAMFAADERLRLYIEHLLDRRLDGL